jgi:hypothetical protein
VSAWTPTDWRIGLFSAVAVLLIVVIYRSTGFMGVVARPPHLRTLQQVDPYLAILEYLIILVAITLVVLMSAVYAYAPPERKTYALAALAFIAIFAAPTCSLPFVALTVVRRVESQWAPEFSRQLSFAGGGQWPTLALAVELLAWDFFFGLGMLFAAPVFRGGRLENSIRGTMTLSGSLCVLATLGPITGEMRIPYLGIVGYAFVLPVICVLLAVLFARATPREPSNF